MLQIEADLNHQPWRSSQLCTHNVDLKWCSKSQRERFRRLPREGSEPHVCMIHNYFTVLMIV